MSIQRFLLIKGLLFFLVFSKVQSIYAQSVSAEAPLASLVASTATGMDGSGRLSGFVDQSGMEFHIAYDNNGRIQSVVRAGAPNARDLVWIGYDSKGRLAKLVLGTGYQIDFAYPSSGKQKVRDQFGNELVRTRQAEGTYSTRRIMDPNGTLATALEPIDTLFTWIAARSPGAAVMTQ